ncbi:MAG: hypothetical protein AAF066_16305 [Pseudomonadota bacterium]
MARLCWRELPVKAFLTKPDHWRMAGEGGRQARRSGEAHNLASCSQGSGPDNSGSAAKSKSCI